MKLITFTIIAAGMAALVLTAGCGKSLQQRIEQAKGNAAEEQRAVEQADQDAQLDYLDEWQAFRSEADKQIAANEKSMNDLKARAAGGDAKLRAKVNTEVEALGRKNAELKKKLKAYQDEGKVNWDAFKRDFSNDLDGLGKALKDLDAAAQK